MGKLVCEIVLNGEEVVKVLTTAPNINLGHFLTLKPGVGKPFWYWSSIPAGTVVSADFTDAPIVTADASANNALIAGITADPADVLTYA